MSGETRLTTLLANMTATLTPGVFVFATLEDGEIPAGIAPQMIFREAEGTTLIAPLQQAEAADLAYTFRCRMITLQVHSSLEAVGFIARVATALAAEGMGVNPVSGYFHDHLFVPEDRAQDAMEILNDLANRTA